MPTEFSQLKNADDALRAFREQQFVGAFVESIKAKAEAAAMDSLRESMPARATALGGEAFSVQQRLDHNQKRSDGLRSLMGWSDDQLPWNLVADNLANTILQEEEMLVRYEDQATNYAAYNMDKSEAVYQFTRQKARVDAFVAAYDEAKAKVGGDDTEPAKAHRRNHPSAATETNA